jgi:perosamine synthetase
LNDSGNIAHNRPWITSADRNAVDAVLASGWIAAGPRVADVEAFFVDYFGAGASCAVSSGTAALFLALKGLKIGEGDVVAVPSYACSALLNAVHMAGAVPRVVDVLLDSLAIDMDAIERQAADAKAVIAVHTFGAPAPIEALRGQGRIIIEDCCQSLGSTIAGDPLGRAGDAAVFSFYATKTVTGGHGGLVLSRRPEVIEHIRDYREFDCRETYYPRFNFQLTDIQAGMVMSQLRRLDEVIARRQVIARRFDDALPAGMSRWPRPDGAGVVPYRYVVQCSDAQEVGRLKMHMAAAGITCIVPVERSELLHNYLSYDAASYPVCERIAGTSLSIPLYPALTGREVDRICEALRCFDA